MALAFVSNVEPVRAQSPTPQPFPAAYERQLWRQLPIWSNLQHNLPSHVFDVEPEDDSKHSSFYDDFDNLDDVFAAEFAALNLGECTFSHFGDFNSDLHTGWDVPIHHVCKGPTGNEVPPAPGAQLMPVSVATDTVDVGGGVLQHRVYVADLFNHRVQVFDFFGNVIKLPFEIGMGRYGRGPHTMDPGPGYPAGAVGELLEMPYSVTVDASHRILVADGGNGRIAVFNPDGSFAFEVDLPDRPEGIGEGDADPVRPYEVVVSPGASVIDPESGDEPTADGRIVVSDWGRCYVFAFNEKFERVGDLPTQLPVNLSHQACVGGAATQPNEFSGVTGTAIDQAGRIYVADHAQNAVQVFDRDLQHLGWIGRPGLETNPLAELEGPVGVAIDHLGRIGVTDGGHSRVAFYSVISNPPPPPPTGLIRFPVQFEFQLDTTVAVEDFNMGLAEQWGTLPGLDEKGRFVATDPLNRRLLRFELPELGIVNPFADAGVGTFDVAVPSQKLGDVLDVVVSVSSPQAGVVITVPPTPTGAVTIGPGEYVSYRFEYTSPHGQTTFNITAAGRTTEGPVTADPAAAIARKSCFPGCQATHTVYADPPPPNPATPPTTIAKAYQDWYGQEVFVRMTPAPGSAPFDRVAYYFEGTLAGHEGFETRETALNPAINGVDVRVRVTGNSRITYWPLTSNGEAGNPTTVDLWLDLGAPHLDFTSWPEPFAINGGVPWYRDDVTATFSVEDNESGAVTPTGTKTITGEGVGLFETFDVFDQVGHSESVHSGTAGGGRYVNIDRTPPVVTAHDLQIVADINGIATVPASFATSASAVDALSGVVGAVTGTGPATVAVGQEIEWTFTATDAVGRVGTAKAKVTTAPSALEYTALRFGEYARALPVSAQMTPAGAAGSLVFTLIDPNPRRGSRTVSAPLDANGNASTEIPLIVNSVGVYDLRVEYVGDFTPRPAPLTVSITIGPTPVGLVAKPADKRYGQADPALDYDFFGTLYHEDDVFSGSLIRDAGENVGQYDIRRDTLTINANYAITYVPAKLTVTAARINVKANDVTRFFGVANPATFGVTITGDALGAVAPVFTVTTTAGQFANVIPGGYPITVTGNNANYEVSFQNGTLTVNPRTVNVFGTTQERLITALVDPVLGYTIEAPTATTGLVNGNVITGALVRGPSIGLNSFATANSGPTPLTAGGNYVINFTPGVLNLVTILTGNNPPIANPDTANTFAGTAVDISVLTNDSDAVGDTLRITEVTTSAGGTVTIVGTKVRFLPNPGFTGPATFSYTITDDKGGYATAQVTVTVTAAGSCTITGFTTYTQGGWGATPNGNNPAKLLQNKFAQVYPGGSVSIGGTKKLFFTSSTAIKNFLPAGGTAGVLTATATNPTSSSAGVFAGQVLAMQLNLDFSNAGVTKPGLGSLMYQGFTVAAIMEAANAVLGGNTAILATYGLSVADLNAIIDAFNRNFDNGTQNLGVLSCPPGTQGPVNRPPTISVSNRSNNKGTAATGSFSGSDPDGDTPLTYSATGLPGGVTLSTTGVFGGTFTTAGSFNVTVTVKDPSNATGTGTFVWTVLNPNTAPTITATSRTNTEGNAVSLQFTGTDTAGDALTYSATGLPTGLSMSSAGKVTGTLGYAAAGTYNVTVIVKDQGNLTGSATFVWTVTNVNTAPDAVNDSATVFKGASVTISVLGNDSDPQGDTISIKSTTNPSKGSIALQSNGTIKYTAPTNWTGTTTFTYTIKDPSGVPDTATVTVTVKSHQSSDGCSNHH
jgi:hypothetical protein